MKELLTLIREYLLKKEPMVLATVVESSGSSPRGPGAMMLAGKGQRLWGSIGGGLCEHLALEEAKALLSQSAKYSPKEKYVPSVAFKKYLLHPSEAAGLGAACGGEVSVFFRSLDAGEPGLLEVVEAALACFGGQKAAWLILEVCSGITEGIAGSTAERPAAGFSLGLLKEDGFMLFSGSEPQTARAKNLQFFQKPAPALNKENGRFWFSVPLISGGFVYVFGGGHIAQELVPLLTHIGFRCIVFDDREEFVRCDLFPAAEKAILGDFENIGKYLTLGERDCAVVVTRGHIWDLEAWAFALDSPAAYIGVIGSKTKHGYVRERLRERGFSSDAINAPRVHAPIGVKIKSKTPAEIAISIAAELISVRAELCPGK